MKDPNCTCSICKRSKKIDAVISSGSTEVMATFIRELQSEICCLEEDLNYRMCIMSGDWPTAVEKLERALLKAREKRAKA